MQAFLEVPQQVQHAEPDGDVQHGHRLVGQQRLGVGAERPRDRHALALPAGQLVRELVEVALRRRELHPGEQVLAAPPRVRGRAPARCRGSAAPASGGSAPCAPGSARRTGPGRSSAPAGRRRGTGARRADVAPSRRAAGSSPAVRGCSCASSRATVDLPEPDSPTIAVTWPRRSVKLTSSTACTLRARCGSAASRPVRRTGKCLDTPSASSTTVCCRRWCPRRRSPDLCPSSSGGRLQVQDDVERVDQRGLRRPYGFCSSGQPVQFLVLYSPPALARRSSGSSACWSTMIFCSVVRRRCGPRRRSALAYAFERRWWPAWFLKRP